MCLSKSICFQHKSRHQGWKNRDITLKNEMINARSAHGHGSLPIKDHAHLKLTRQTRENVHAAMEYDKSQAAVRRQLTAMETDIAIPDVPPKTRTSKYIETDGEA